MKMKMKAMMTKRKMMSWVPMLVLLRTILKTRNEMILIMGWVGCMDFGVV
jgi:hypothetical protein